MADTIDAPEIRLLLRLDRDAAPQPLRFLRWRLIPLGANLPAGEPDASEEHHGLSSESAK
jgi:hypothetical protein